MSRSFLFPFVRPSNISVIRVLHSVISVRQLDGAFCVQCSTISDISLLGGSQASPTYPPDKSSIKMGMEHLWNETHGRKPHDPQNNLSQCNYVNHKVHMDWAGIESAYARSHCSRLTNAHFSADRIENAVAVGSLNWFRFGGASHRVLYISPSTLPNISVMFTVTKHCTASIFVSELLALERTTSLLYSDRWYCPLCNAQSGDLKKTKEQGRQCAYNVTM
jgi:hypothetical protein